MRSDLPKMPDAEHPSMRHAVAVGPDVDVESWRLTVPARGGCYLFCDEHGRPIQIGAVAGMRSVLLNRLGPDEDGQAAKTTDYRTITRHVRWREAFSRFEANWTYLENARRLFPDRYARLIRHWQGHWLQVDVEAEHPRFVPAREPADRPGLWFGPLPTAQAARLVVQTLEELFDLCRYHEQLVLAPHGRPCAYKEMGKCPSPCDGTVGLDHYRGQIAEAVGMLSRGIEAWVDEAEAQMQAASRALAFERAAALKAKVDAANPLLGEPMRWMRPLEAFRFLLLQPGRRKGCPRAFAVTPGRIVFLGEVQQRRRAAQISWLTGVAPGILTTAPMQLDRPGVERIGLVAWHLLRGERDTGVFLDPDDAADEAKVIKAIDRQADRKPADNSDGDLVDGTDAEDPSTPDKPV